MIPIFLIASLAGNAEYPLRVRIGIAAILSAIYLTCLPA